MFDYSQDVAPSSLSTVPAGPELAAVLADVDVESLSAHDRIEVLTAHRHLVAHYEAKASADVMAVENHFRAEGDSDQDAFSGAAAEVRAALRLTRRAADGKVWMADALWRRLPRVGLALLRGEICSRRARVLVHGTEHVPVHTARTVVRDLAAAAGELTTGQLRARVRKRCFEADRDEAQKLLAKTIDQRRVDSRMTAAGAGDLFILDAAPDRIAAAGRLINHMARNLRAGGDDRTMDQLRADVALDLLNGALLKSGDKRLGGVLMTTDLASLAGLENHAGELNGFGPVIADVARQTVAQQHDVPWEYVVRDGDTGRIVASGTTNRRPSTSQSRFVRARDPVCVFPGCRMPATDCDVDHKTPWAESNRTDVAGLAPACRHDHVVRHTHGWTYRFLPTGQVEWTTRLGHTYATLRDPP